VKQGKIKAVLLDLDGTLLDTYDDFAAAMNRAFEKCGFGLRPHDYFIRFFGAGIRDIFRAALPEDTDADRFEQVLAMYVDDYTQNCTDMTAQYPDMERVLFEAVKKGCRIGVITNKTEYVSKLQISHFYPDMPFEFVWGNDGVRTLKPNGATGAAACRTLGVEPDEVIYIGDSETDMQFAKNSGFFALGAAWGYRGREILLEAGADAVIDSASEIADYI